MIEVDSEGFPVLPDVFDMDETLREERMAKGLKFNSLADKIAALRDLDERAALNLRFGCFTNSNDTRDLMQAGITPILVREDDLTALDMGASSDELLDETLSLGVHWFASREHLYLSVQGWLRSNPDRGFSFMLYGGEQKYDFTPYQLSVLEECADRNEY